MKDKRKKIGIVAVVLILLIALITGYTYSKYHQSVSVNVTSAVAKWKFSGEIVNSKNSSTESTISLADTIESSSVAEKRIAPGTKGEFSIVIDATGSEVDLSYIVELTEETNKPQNLFFTYKGKQYASLSSLLSEVDESSNKEFSGKILNTDSNKEKVYKISWEWPYETLVSGVAQDEADLNDGQNIQDYTFTVKITGSQVVE